MKRPDPACHEIDERFLLEWVEFGLNEIASYLTKHLAFLRWLDANPSKEEE